MLNNELAEIFERDLNKLKNEISYYTDERNLWYVEESINNSAGNLCLHIVGNLNHFVGAVLGGDGYIRERDKEFSLKNIPKDELISSIDNLIGTLKKSFSKMSDEVLNKIYPINVYQKEMTTRFFLVSLAAHLNYHLGQVNYHRRLLDK